MNDAGALTVKTARDGRICVLTLGGDLDFLAATKFLERAAGVVDDRTERLVLDLAGLTFLDCAGARALANATYLAPGGCPVIIRSLSRAAHRVLDLLGLKLGHPRQEPDEGLEHHVTPDAAGAIVEQAGVELRNPDPKAKGPDHHKARYRAATREPVAGANHDLTRFGADPDQADERHGGRLPFIKRSARGR